MTKTLRLFGALVCAALILGIITVSGHARITGTPPTSADVWCAGPSGAEVCVDASGNVIPTTDNDADLGTSALRFKDLYVAGSLTLAAGAIDTAKIGTDAVTTVKLINSAVDTAKLASDAVTTAKVLNLAIDTTKLATDSVITAKLINSAVDTAKLATDSVTVSKILNSTIDTSKINKVGAGVGALCEMNDGTGKFGHCSASDASVCTCQ